jgi:hypothetical protein
MAFNIPSPSSDPVGSGNPYYGSGFTNFDNWLTQWGADMGAAQEGENPEWGPYEKWMYQVGQENKQPVVPEVKPDDSVHYAKEPLPPEPPPPPEEPEIPEEPEDRLPSWKRDQLDRNNNAYPELEDYGRRNGAW